MRAWRATNLSAGLTFGQRLHRLWTFATGSGAYVHPDGHIELDFEEAAGIDSRVDSEERQETLLARYEERKHRREMSGARTVGAMVLGAVGTALLHQFAGLSWEEGALYGASIAWGCHLLTRH